MELLYATSDWFILIVVVLSIFMIMWVILTLKRQVYGSALILISLFCFFQYLEIQNEVQTLCDTGSFFLDLLVYESCDEATTYSNVFLISSIGSGFSGSYLLLKPKI